MRLTRKRKLDMCNLYKMTASVNELAKLFGRFHGDRENLPAYDEIYPDREAPVMTAGDCQLALKRMTWGIPPWREKMRPITNVRNLESQFWRNMLAKPESRCLVPVTSFCEWTGEKGSKRKIWFGMKDETPFSFAGIWRDTQDGPRMAFLTCEPNSIVAPIHPKAMPVILATENYEQWLYGDLDEARALAAPFPSNQMAVI